MQPNLVTSRARPPLGILIAALFVLNIAAQSAAATTTPESSTSAASSLITSVTSSPTELRIAWSSSMIGGSANDPAKYSSPDGALATSLARMTPVPGLDGALVTFRYSRPLVPGTYTLEIAQVQDTGGNSIAPSTHAVSLSTSSKLLALIAEPNNPFPPGPGMRPIEEGWQLVNAPPDIGFGSASAGGEWWLDTGVSIGTFGGGDWRVELSAPRGQALVPGIYTNAVRSPFRPAGVPGIDVSGVGTGCNTTSGNFEVRDIAFIDDPRFGRKPVRLDASFDFRCDTFTSRIFGLVRYSQDTTPPVISANISPAPNADGWNNSPVRVTWSVSDPESGVASSLCFTTNVTTETGFYYIPCSATNGDGLGANTFVVVHLDTTRPTITASTSPSPNANGWNDTPVDVSFTCADPLSIWGFASGLASCSSGVTVGEGAAQTVSGEAIDRAGNVTTAQATGINVDLTAPTLAYTGNQGRYEVDETVAIHCAAQDALSGLDTTTCVDVTGAAYQFPLGSNSLSATATDRAGHSGSASTSFTVAVTPQSLCGLTKQFVQSSARYAALTATRQTQTDQLITTVCARVTAIAPKLTATQKQGAIVAYQHAVDSLVSSGWLTPSQGVTLKTLAAAL